LAERIAPHAVGNAVTKRHQPVDHRWWWHILRRRAQPPQQFALTAWWQVVEQRQMRTQHIALRRKMRAPQTIGPRKICVTQKR
jgi:hypothetical protein